MFARKQRLFPAIAFLCALLALTPALALAQEAPGVFPSPEDAIRFFVNALTENDYEKALQACAVDEYVEGFDFAGSVDRLKVLMPPQMMAPSEYEMYIEMNRISTMATLTSQIKMMIYSFFIPELRKDAAPLYVEGAYAEEFIEKVDPSKLKNLKVLRIDPPVQDILNSEKNITNFQKVAELYGAQEQTERVALYSLDGVTYAGGFGLMRYDDSWKIIRFNSNLAGQTSYGTVEEMTESAYASLL